MGRRRNNTPPAQLPAKAPTQGEIVPDGDFAGMRYEDVTDRIVDDVTNAYAPLTLEGVCMVHDYVLAEILEVCEAQGGATYARDVAERFQMTIDPYIRRGRLEDLVWSELIKTRRLIRDE